MLLTLEVATLRSLAIHLPLTFHSTMHPVKARVVKTHSQGQIKFAFFLFIKGNRALHRCLFSRQHFSFPVFAHCVFRFFSFAALRFRHNMEFLTGEMAPMGVTSSQSEPETTTVELCTNGDFTLVVGHKHFVVCSEILKISSPYFKILFSPKFQEGNAIQNGGNPEIVLHEDDPEVMEIILSILHYRFQPNLHHLEPQMILKVAQHSDKYQCNKPLTPWIMQWMQKAQKPGSVRHFDYLLTAAHIFGAEEYLNTTSVAAIRNLPPNFNVANDELFLPENLQSQFNKWYQVQGLC